MLKKRLEEIMKRKRELIAQIDNTENPVTAEAMAAIEEEQRSLEREEEEIRSKLDLAGKLGKNLEKPEEKGDEAEERAKAFVESGKMKIGATETRATLIATGTIVTPSKAGDTIRDTMETVSSIVDQVETVDLTGCGSYEEAYVKTEMVAGTREDGKAATNTTDPEFRIAKLQPYTVNVTAYVSKNLSRVTPLQYEAKVKQLALRALKKKLANMIANGESVFFGIKTAKNTKSEDICKEVVVDSNKIDENTLHKIVFGYGGSDELGGNARLYLTKEDLEAFGKVRGTNEKRNLYEITPDTGNANTGVIKNGGLIVPYTLLSGLTSLSTATKGSAKIQTMLYGDPKNFELGLFGDYSIEVSKDYKFAEGLLAIMGEVMVGGNVIVDGGFVVVTLAANA